MSKMTVKEILRETAQLLGLRAVVAYFDGDEEEQEEVHELLRCFNVVENELALDYLPLYAETEVETTTGVVQYESLPFSIVRVLRVRDSADESVKYTLFPTYLKASAGKLTIAYTYAPQTKTLEDESDYQLQASKRLFAYGIAAEYALAQGAFEDAGIWDKKYKDALTAAYRARPCKILRSRRWA